MLRWIALSLIVTGLTWPARAQDDCIFCAHDSAENFVKTLDATATM